MMTGMPEDRVIVVTGATGIAAACAQRIGAMGATVFTISLADAECELLHERMDELGIGHAWASADLRDESAAVRAFTACLERFGRIDGLVCVAGGSGRAFGDGTIDTIALDAWTATLDLNLTTTFLSVRETVRHMLAREGGGSIVIVSSVLAEHPSPSRFGTHAYAVAKGGQLALVRTTAAAYASRGIRVNAVAPSVVRTPMSERAQADPELVRYVEAKQPLTQGFLDPDTVAAAVAYLVSEDAAAVTGQVLTVDGGWSTTEVGS